MRTSESSIAVILTCDVFDRCAIAGADKRAVDIDGAR
jgi:hypothetical protein